MLNLKRKAYKEEIRITEDIGIFIIFLLMFFIEIRCNKPFFQGLIVGFICYGWLPAFVVHILDLREKHLEQEIDLELNKLKEKMKNDFEIEIKRIDKEK